MDVDSLRIIATVASFITFIGILIWVYRRRDSSFDEAAQLPFEHEDALPASPGKQEDTK